MRNVCFVTLFNVKRIFKPFIKLFHAKLLFIYKTVTKLRIVEVKCRDLV